MKLNHKALKLIDMGLSSKTVSKLTEGQINVLYSKLLSEAQTVTTTQTTYTKDEVQRMKSQGASLPGGKAVKLNPDDSVTITKEGELDEDSPLEKDSEQDFTGQELPHDEKDISPDGMDDDTDNDTKMVGMSEGKRKKNPWAICTSQLSDEFGTSERSEWSKSQMKKYERCVNDVKDSLKEGKNPVSLFLEQKLQKIVEKHIPPRMTKKELMTYLSEAPAVAPSKPTTKPTTKPGTRPSSPGKNPFPKEHPAPKAKSPSPEKAKKVVIDLIMNLIGNNEK